ncbi:AMP-binding protein [Pseudomonas aeruginosa]|nr:AMP-binding protein [Pseudomonas aeruginosa]
MRAERLARGLRARGVVAEALVAIAAERSFDLVVGLLGILKAGAGYLPLDPNYPAGAWRTCCATAARAG